MAEREFDLAKAPDRFPAQPPMLPERLVLSYRGRVHFQEAIDMAATTKGSDVMNALVGVARNMTEAGIPPTSVLDRLTTIRDGISVENDTNGEEERNRSFIELGVADVQGMLGDTSNFPTLLESPEKDDVLWTVSPYIHAGEALVRQGEAPTPILEQVMDRIARNNPHYDNHFGKTIEYARVARVFHKAGLDPKMAFTRAEQTLETAKQRSKRDFFDYRSYEELGVGYAACGLEEDAFRMVDLIGTTVDKDEGRDWEVSQALQKIAQEHLSQGNYEAAVNAAKRLNWDGFTAKMLAHKAVGEVRQGVDASPTIDEATIVIKDAQYEEAYYEEVYPLLGLALEQSGRTEEAQAMFRGIRTAIDEMDVFYKADVGFELAKAIDEAGYEAEGLYRQSFEWADQFRTEEPDWESMYGMSRGTYEHGIRNLIEGGRFDLAKEYLDKYTDDGWSKSRLIADLAKGEAMSGLLLSEIDTLTPPEVQQFFSGDESIKQAALYFGLDNRTV